MTDEIMARLGSEKRDCQFELFRKVLCAIYTRPYAINTCAELENITKLGDFYCALPIISATIIPALMGSPMFDWVPNDSKWSTTTFARNAHDLLLTAEKLRNKILYREWFIHTVGRWRLLIYYGKDAKSK